MLIESKGGFHTSISDYLGALAEFLVSNINRVLFSVVIFVVGYVVYRLYTKEITILKNRKRLQEHIAFTLVRFGKWITIIAVFSAILAQFDIALGMLSAVVSVLGGTIIGFAAINTIGNAIAGLIVMTSRPFEVGDRILFEGQFADIVSIDLIYTKMVTLDNVTISVPNQELLKSEIVNYENDKVVRRHVSVTPGFEYGSFDVEKALLEAADKVPKALKEPKPYVWITNFQSYAVEYTLYVFIDDIKGLPEIDAELHRAVLETCKSHEIDISTPMLLRQIKE